MKKITAVLLIVGLLVSTGAYSAVMVRGGASCGQWVSEEGVSKALNQLWLLGYLSGLVAYSDKDALKGTDSPSIFLWMDNYCKANPLKRVDEGGQDLYLELVKQKGL
jgi:hypothetical protein